MLTTPTIHVVVPTFNRKDHLARCLRCLVAQDTPLSIIVSDSGSTDGTAEMIDGTFPEVTRVSGHAGLWWTGAINIGLEQARKVAADDDYFLLLNDDTEVEPHFISTLLSIAGGARRVVGAVCVDRQAPTQIVDGGTIVNWWTAKMQVLNCGKSLREFASGHAESVSVLSGRGALYPISVFSEVGVPAASALPHYAADYEYSRRCAANGYELIVSYDAVVRGDLTATGIHRPHCRWSIPAAFHFFFGRKSACNLIDRYHFARLTAKGFISGTIFYLCTIARLLARFLLSPATEMPKRS